MDTIFAISTPPGIGGIAVVRISGPQAIEACNAIFRPFKASHSLLSRPSHSLTYGTINQGDQVLDEVVVSLFRAPNSFTGEDVVEIYCHGSLYIQQQILNILSALNAQPSSFDLTPSSLNSKTNPLNLRLAEPGEFTRRAFANGRLDLAQAEAVADLIASQNAASHRLAMSQMKGSISRKLDSLHDQLLRLSTLLELELDFSEEDVEFADRTELRQLATAIDQEVTHLSSTFQTGQAIRNGIPVAIIGAPNVGKSTLLNTLLRDDRAIVSDIQGTTRDVIEDTIYISSPSGEGHEGALFRFIDTAGIRNTSDSIEQMGIERSRRAAERARIILLLTEPGISYPDIKPTADQHIIHIVNKTDLTPNPDHSFVDREGNTHPVLSISAKHDIGIDTLEQKLLEVSGIHDVQGDLILTNRRHYDALCEAHRYLQQFLSGLDSQLSGDLIAEDLRAVIESLNSILGREITSQDTLNNIFKNFCIGK